MRIRYSLLTLCVFASACPVAWGQTTATIVGTVTDPSGAVVPNVSITAA